MKTLVIAAHPDDEVLGCGGTIAKLQRKQSSEIKHMIISKGRMDEIDQKFDGKPLIHFTTMVEDVIREYEPTVIYTHTGGDINQDHKVLHEAVLIACRPARSYVRAIYAFNSTMSPFDTFGPTHYEALGSEDLQTKIDIMKEKYSHEMDLPYRDEEGIRAQAKYWGSQIGTEYAEAFETVIRIGGL